MSIRRFRALRFLLCLSVAMLGTAILQCGEEDGPAEPEPPRCAAPTFAPPAGTYPDAQTVAIASATPEASIRYTRDGSAPEEISPLYTAPLLVESSTIVRARAWRAGWSPSEIATAEYIIARRVAAPVFAPAAGSYAAPVTVTLTCATEGTRITFTADGAEPLEGSPEYTEPIRVSESVTLKARGWREGWEPSEVAVAVYEIVGCELAIERPNGGETWCAGLEQEIRWSRPGSCGRRVRVELWRGGSVCALIAAETENDGSLLWTPAPCDGAADGYRVRLTDLESGAWAESEAPFAISDPCRIEVASPNGGEIWTEGSTQTIRWNRSGCCNRSVRIDLLRDGAVCATIEENAANNGSRDWTVAACAGPGVGYAIRVSDPSTGSSDDSDGVFSIAPASACELSLLEPAFGAEWCEGTERTIRWSASGPCGEEVRLELLRAGAVCATIAAATANDGHEAWRPARCGGLEDGYAVRVSDPATGASAASDGTLAIRPACSLEIASPDGAEVWNEGGLYTIEWSRSGCCGSRVRLELLRGGAVCAVIAAATDNDGSYAWRAVACAGAEAGYSIRVTDLETGATDESDAAFAIPAEIVCAMAVTSPAAAESWCEGSMQTIRWEAAEPCGPEVRIELLQGGGVCATIAEATGNDGSFEWAPVRCGGQSSGYAVRVTDLETGAAAVSAGAFLVPAPCSIAVISPDGGETWIEGTARTIRWIGAGCCGPAVRIELLRDGFVCAEIAGATENDGNHPWVAAACAGPTSGYAVRVTDLSTGALDESDGTFSIPGSAVCAVEVTDPEAAASWCEGTERTIRWNATGPCGGQVRIELLRNLAVCALLAEAADNDGSFSWRAAQCFGQAGGYSVRVTDRETNASGQSPGFFAIPDSCAVSVDSPDGGESWCEGSIREIRWTRSGCCGSAARIELLRDGAVCAEIAAATDNDGSFSWTVARCGGFADGYSVRVVDLETGASGESGGPFAIPGACSVAVTSPNGGEAWCEGTSQEIRWSASGCCGSSVRIELLREGVLCSLLSAATPNDGSFSWPAAACAGTGDGYAVRVVDLHSGAADESDAAFTLAGACALAVTSPNGGESWCEGTSREIRWRASGCCGTSVRIDLLRNGVLCSTLTEATENDGVFAWPAAQCGDFTDRYTIRIADPATGASDQSDAFFSIPDPCALPLTSPNGGESWCEGTSQEIRWSPSGCCGPTARIELLRNGAVCAEIAASTPNDGSFVWAAAQCGDFTDGYAIRVTDGQTGASDQSGAVFSIPDPCALQLTSPNGGESWCEGTSQEIRWSPSGCCSPAVRIELLRNGAVCAQIAASTPNDGSFVWAAAQCGGFTDGYAIRVTDAQTGASDQSGAVFSIPDPCALQLTSPNGGESWCEGETIEIAWTSGGCCGAGVILELFRDDAFCRTISASTPNDGNFSWTAEGCDGEEGYRIRVFDPETGAEDLGDAAFGIRDATTATCVLSPAALEFGEVPIGQSARLSFVLRNAGCAELFGEVSGSCDDFVLAEGAGGYSLLPGDSLRVVVVFEPDSCGLRSCAVETGNPACGPVECAGTAVLDSCQVAPAQLDFGEIPVGEFGDLSFEIVNHGCAPMTGEVSEDCADYTILSGEGVYSLDPGGSLQVTVRFEPADPDPSSCTVVTGAGCAAVECAGVGTPARR